MEYEIKEIKKSLLDKYNIKTDSDLIKQLELTDIKKEKLFAWLEYQCTIEYYNGYKDSKKENFILDIEDFDNLIDVIIPCALFHVSDTDVDENGCKLKEVILLDILSKNKWCLKHKPLSWFIEMFIK